MSDLKNIQSFADFFQDFNLTNESSLYENEGEFSMGPVIEEIKASPEMADVKNSINEKSEDSEKAEGAIVSLISLSMNKAYWRISNALMTDSQDDFSIFKSMIKNINKRRSEKDKIRVYEGLLKSVEKGLGWSTIKEAIHSVGDELVGIKEFFKTSEKAYNRVWGSDDEEELRSWGFE